MLATEPPTEGIVDVASGEVLYSRSEPLEAVCAIMRCGSSAEAQAILSHHLNKIHRASVDVPVPLATAVRNGLLLWVNELIPGPFSFLSVAPLAAHGYRRQYTDADLLRLQCEEERGIGASDRTIADNSQMRHRVPLSISDYLDQLHNFIALCGLLFGLAAPITKSLYAFAC